MPVGGSASATCGRGCPSCRSRRSSGDPPLKDSPDSNPPRPVLPTAAGRVAPLPGCGRFGGELLLGGGPGGEQPERVRRGRPGGGGVDVEVQAWCGGELHGLEVEVELADDRVTEPL